MTRSIFTNKIFQIISFVFAFLAITLFISYLVLAWTDPTQTPPQGNVTAPLNVGPQGQSKAGGLILNTGGATNGLIVQYGNVGIGTTAPGARLEISGGYLTSGGPRNTNLKIASGGTSPNAAQIYWGDNTGWRLHFGTFDSSNNFQPRVTFVDTGNVGIGATDPATRLEVRGGALCVRSGTGVSCNTNSGAISAQYFYYISDLRLKQNIQPVENALSRLTKLSGISYETIYDRTRSLGLIAQEVEKVFPEVVSTDKETGLKWIDYGKLTPVLIEAIKEQQKEIEKLKAEIELLRAK